MTNARPTVQTVHVLVSFDGEPVTWRTIEAVAAYDPETNEAGGGAIEPDWPDERGTFVVRARLGDRSSWQTLNPADAVDAGQPCTDVSIEIGTPAAADRPLALTFADACSDADG